MSTLLENNKPEFISFTTKVAIINKAKNTHILLIPTTEDDYKKWLDRKRLISGVSYYAMYRPVCYNLIDLPELVTELKAWCDSQNVVVLFNMNESYLEYYDDVKHTLINNGFSIPDDKFGFGLVYYPRRMPR